MKKTKGLVLLWLCLFSPLGLFGQSGLDPRILEKIKLVKEGNETVAEVSMETLLSLALERSSTADLLQQEEAIAKARMLEAQNANQLMWSNQILQNRAPSVYATNLQGATGSLGYQDPYLTMLRSDSTTFSTGVSQRLKSGVSYGLTYNKVVSQTSLGMVSSQGDALEEWNQKDDPLYMDSLIAKVNVPLIKDLGEVNLIGEKKSALGLEQTKLGARRTKLQLLQMVAEIYWDLVSVTQKIKAQEENLKLARQFYQDNQTRQQLGQIDGVEVKLSEAQLALAQQSLLAQVTRKKMIEDQLKAALNLASIPYAYRPTEKHQIRQVKEDYSKILDRVLSKSADMSLLQVGMQANSLDLEQAYNQDATDLDFFVQYQFNGFGADFAESGKNLTRSNTSGYQVGLSLSIPLWDHATPRLIERTKLERVKLEVQKQDRISQIEVQLQSILRNLELAKESIRLAQISAELNQELLEKESALFKVGKSTAFRVSQVRQDLTQARVSLVDAQVSYEKVWLSYLVLSEEIFSTYHLSPLG